MMGMYERKLDWTQRIALVRHGVHVATRTRNFTFFKILQAQNYLDGTDHIASLSATLGDEADGVVSSLDKFNAVIICVYEDSFKAVYDSIKQTARDSSSTLADRRAIYFVDAARHKQLSSAAVDKMFNMAVTVIQAQPEECQCEAADIFITGMAIVADAVEVALLEIDRMEHLLSDFIRLEESWSLVQSSTGSTVSAIKGVFNLMAASPNKPDDQSSSSFHGQQYRHTRTSSIDSYAKNMLRRMSTAMSGSSVAQSYHSTGSASTSLSGSTSRLCSTTPSASRRSSVQSVSSMISPKRHSFASSSSSTDGNNYYSNRNSGHTQTLSPIPPTPADYLIDPFDKAFDHEEPHQSNNNSIPSSPGRTRPRPRSDSVHLAPNEQSPETPASTTASIEASQHSPDVSPTASREAVPTTTSDVPYKPLPQRPGLDSGPQSMTSFASTRSNDSASVYADDPLLRDNSNPTNKREYQVNVGPKRVSQSYEHTSLLGRISSVLYAAPVGKENGAMME